MPGSSRLRFLGIALAVTASGFLGVSAGGAQSPAPASTIPDAGAIAAQLEQKYDAGVTRALAPAQTLYRDALALSAAGNADEAIRLLEAASEFDPEYPDAHFTLGRLLVLRDPGRAVGEWNQALRIVGSSYPWQRYLLANALTGLAAVWILSLLFALIGISVRHLPHLVHITQEIMSARPSAGVKAAAAVTSVAPVLWGLGPVPTATLFTGLLSFRLGKREALLVGLFLISTLLLAGGLATIAPWAGAPTLEEPSLLVDRAMNSGYDADLASALIAWQGQDTTEPLFPFALGSMARRSGDLDLAERQLTYAAVLQPRTAWILTNLGNVYFAREEYARARETYDAAAAVDPTAVEPHFNLAQVYTKQLMFAEASREQSLASAVGFDRVRDFSRISAPQLNRTVMDASPPSESLWSLAGRSHLRGADALAGNPTLRWIAGLAPPAPFALVFLPAIFLIFAGLGQVLGRSLATLHCSNCQKIICRRCVHRMQQRAFCADCFRSVKDLKSAEFTRLLLTRRDRSASRRRTIGQALVTFLLPGAGQMLRGATLSGFFALLVMVSAALLLVMNGAILPSLDVLPVPTAGWAKRIPLLLLFVLTYALTVARYFSTTTSRVQGIGSAAPREARAGVDTRAKESWRS